MSHEAAVQFLTRVGAAEVAQAKAADDAVTWTVEAGRAAGLDFTRDELEDVAKAARMATLSEDELAKVTGGVPEAGPVGRLASETGLRDLAPTAVELVGFIAPEPWAG